MNEDEMIISKEEYQKIKTILYACCLRMGVQDKNHLYDAVQSADEAIKAFILDEDNGEKIKAWWNSREF